LPTACAAVALATFACTGPRLLVENDGKHAVFLDGRRLYDDEVKFRYYGTTRWDALPADRDGAPDWTLRPASQEVAITPPVPPWLFPLDFPLELLAWTFGGGGDTTTRVVLPSTDAQRRAESELGNAQLAAMAERALAARSSRTSP
jgi:hypothetical protein